MCRFQHLTTESIEVEVFNWSRLARFSGTKKNLSHIQFGESITWQAFVDIFKLKQLNFKSIVYNLLFKVEADGANMNIK